jgi:pimeloyl-ACP methyl ester carboxylesterase
MQKRRLELCEGSVRATITKVESAVLSITAEISGHEQGFPVVLLHGWPDDVRTWDRILPSLHAAGFRTVAPYLRGCGPTRFRSRDTARSGQLAALGQDILDLADGLHLDSFAVVGHDWGARAAYIASCVAGPNRITRCAALSVGWGTNDPGQSLSLKQAQNYWYHWYMALPRGEQLIRNHRHAFARYLWTIWAPNWGFTEDEFAATAGSFENPDWADVVLHSYRVRWGFADGDPLYSSLERQLIHHPSISVPTLVIHGGADPCNDPSTSAGKESLFSGHYRRVVLGGVGHFPQREAPTAVADLLTAFLDPVVAKSAPEN